MRVRAIHATKACERQMLTTHVHVVPMHSCVLLHARCWMVFLASAALLAGAPHSTHDMRTHKHKHMHVHIVSYRRTRHCDYASAPSLHSIAP